MQRREKALDMLRALGSWSHLVIQYTKERIPSTKGKPFCGPDPTHPSRPSVQGTTVQAQEPECLQVRSALMLQPQHLTCLCSACCGHTPLHTPILAFGDPAQYLGHSNNEATQLQRSNNSAGVSFHASRRKTTTRYGDLRCTGSYEGVQNPPLPLLRILSTHSRRSRTRISGDDTATVTAPDRRERFHKK